MNLTFGDVHLFWSEGFSVPSGTFKPLRLAWLCLGAASCHDAESDVALNTPTVQEISLAQIRSAAQRCEVLDHIPGMDYHNFTDASFLYLFLEEVGGDFEYREIEERKSRRISCVEATLNLQGCNFSASVLPESTTEKNVALFLEAGSLPIGEPSDRPPSKYCMRIISSKFPG